jgi:hypothetical protein
MSCLEKLQVKGISIDKEWCSGFVNVGRYKHFRVCVNSDSNLEVHFIWSTDGINTGVITLHQFTKNMWITNKVDVLMQFVNLRIINLGNKPNTRTIVSVLGRTALIDESKHVTISIPEKEEIKDKFIPLPLPLVESPKLELDKIEPIEDIKEPVKEPLKEHKVNNVLHRFIPKRRNNVPLPKSLSESRLPKYIPKGSLLIGGPANSIITLQIGAPGDYLRIGYDGKPYWSSD